MSRLLRLGIGATCALALSLSVPQGAVAGQSHREAVASSPGVQKALVTKETAAPNPSAIVVVEETAAPLPYGAQVVVQESEIGFTVATQFASPPEIGGAVHVTSTSVTVGIAHQSAAKKSSPEVAHPLLQ